MRTLLLSFILTIFVSSTAISQESAMNELPYYQIPEAPESYTSGAVISRMIDGLGFRYYWATEGLTETDLIYKPSPKGRTSEETIRHIYDLSEIIVNTAFQKINDFTVEKKTLSYIEMREMTLNNLKKASDLFRELDNLEDNKLIFKSANGTREFPFWNNINGPISDAIWHCGQLVSFRRASGNPFNSKASVLTGQVRQ